MKTPDLRGLRAEVEAARAAIEALEARHAEEYAAASIVLGRAVRAAWEAERATHPSEYGGPCVHAGPRADCRICPPL